MQKQKVVLIISVTIIAVSVVFIAQRAFGVSVGGLLNMGGNKITNLGDPGPPATAADFDAATVSFVKTVVAGGGGPNYIPKWDSDLALVGSSIYDNGNVGIGTLTPGTDKLRVEGGPVNAVGGLIMQTIANKAFTSEPTTVGSIWMCVDIDGKCDG